MSAPSTTVQYRVSLQPAQHTLRVSMRVDAPPPGPLRLIIPTWVPGAYAFLRYARNLSEVTAVDPRSGATVDVQRDGLTAWVVPGPGTSVEVRYNVYLAEPAWSEMHGYVDHDAAVLLGTNLLQAPAHQGAVTVEYELPQGWAVHHPAGARATGSSSWEYPSYYIALDTPVTLGRFERLTREFNGTPFHFVFVNRCVGFEEERNAFLDGAMKIVEETHAIFGMFPFKDYTFLCSFSPQHHWGLEHRASTMVAFGELGLIDATERRRAMRLMAHELFHAWNVCSLKPVEFVTPDLERGSFTDLLWVAEGLTRYFEYLLPVRAREMPPEEFFSNLCGFHKHLSWLPAYQHVSAQDSSRATFLNHHRYPGSPNNSVDYYDVGMLIALDMDATLLAAGKSLDGEFAAFYQRFVATGFTHAQWLEFFGGRTPALLPVLQRDVSGAGQLGVEASLASLGFSLEHHTVPVLGITLQDNTLPTVLNVFHGSPAAAAGLSPLDVIQRVDGFPFSLKALNYALSLKRPVALTVQRGHQWHTFQVTPSQRSQLKTLTWNGSPQQLAAVQAWLRRPDWAPAAGTVIPLTAYENFHGVHTLL